jgi:hypothetical protein
MGMALLIVRISPGDPRSRQDVDRCCKDRGVTYPRSDSNPVNWRIDVPQDRIDLYLELSNEPRGLTSDEVAKLLELVDAWQSLEYARHVALMTALEQG